MNQISPEPFPTPAIPVPNLRAAALAPRVVSAAGRFAAGGTFLADCWVDLRRVPRISWRLFVRSIIRQYRHSSLGIVLAIAPVAVTALVIAFGRRADFFSSEIAGVNSAFFGAFGILMAQAFLDSFGSTQRVFAENQALLKRQNLPIEAVIAADFIEMVFNDLIRLVVIGVLLAAFSIAPSPWLPLAFAGLLGVSFTGGAIGLLLAPISGLHSDLKHLSRGLMPVVLTVTPVFFIPAAGSALGRVHDANPLAWMFDGVRAATYGGSGSIAMAGWSAAAGFAALIVGWLVCRIARPHVVERLLSY